MGGEATMLELTAQALKLKKSGNAGGTRSDKGGASDGVTHDSATGLR